MSRYTYYNRNPNRLELKDCVCRAISTVTGLNYNAVDNLLDLTAKEYECDKLCVCCYRYLLEEVFLFPCRKCYFKQTASEVASNYPNNKLIIRTDAHLTSGIYGKVFDIWDCSAELVDCFWIVE